MSLKQEIESWVEALGFYDGGDYEKALDKFEEIADTSKIFFNIGIIHATLGEHEKAVENYQKAVRLDQYFAVAYFQQGVSNFLLGDFEEALANFNDSLLYLRGNTLIDYDQLGLKFRLYSCEVLFNRGLCYIYLQQKEAGMQDFSYAVKEKQIEDHNVIDEAIKEEAEGYTVFSIKEGVVYRPNEAKVRNVKTKDYLGKARLVAAADRNNVFTGFAGTEVKKQAMGEVVGDDRQPTEISYAATNLVKPGLSSNRGKDDDKPLPHVFPPTPPPEKDSMRGPVRSNTVGSAPTARAMSVRSGNRAADREFGRRRDMSERPDMRNRQDQAPPERRAFSSSRIGSVRAGSRNQFQRDAPRRRLTEFSDEDAYGELYDMYQEGSSSRSGGSGRAPPRRRQPRYDEDDEYASDAFEGSSQDDEFDMIVPSGSVRSGGSRRGGPEVKKIKVKAHGEDTRMILISTGIEYDEFMNRLKEKFGYRKRVRCKIRDDDDGEMISIGDQEDLDLAISSSKKQARRERNDMGKLEIWVQEAP